MPRCRHGTISVFDDWKCDIWQSTDSTEMVWRPIRIVCVDISPLWLRCDLEGSIPRECVQRFESVEIRECDALCVGKWAIHWHRRIEWIVILEFSAEPHRWTVHATNRKVFVHIWNGSGGEEHGSSWRFIGTHDDAVPLVISFGMCADQQRSVVGEKSGRIDRGAYLEIDWLPDSRHHSDGFRSNQWLVETIAFAAKPVENARRTHIRPINVEGGRCNRARR